MSAVSPEFLELQGALAGEYSLERELGRGGMGVVYLARDVQLDRLVAIKVLPGHLANRAEDRDRFLREARTAAGLSHPHIVPIHRVGEAGGFVFFVMSYIAGETLGDRLRAKGPLPAAEAMRIMREVAWALAHAHTHGVVHRDVKPDNILLEEGTGRALVTDFGIAHRDDAVAITDPGKIMGTAHFMSPEQAGSGPVDGRSDLYSLGVVGYLAASGRLPFEASSLPVLIVRQATEEAPSVSHVAPGLPGALARAIERCLRLDPAERFANGAELAAALAPASDGRPALPAVLQQWIASTNPAQWAYSAFSGVTTFFFVGQLVMSLQPHRHGLMSTLPQNFAVIFAPLIPIIGYHVSQGRKLFRDGFSLADLRRALDVASAERRAAEAAESTSLTLAQQVLRGFTYLSGAVAFTMSTMSDLIYEMGLSIPHFRTTVPGAWIVTILFLIAMNMTDVPILPTSVRRFFRVGVRERLWQGRLGAWIARKLKAPVTGRAISATAFHATEAALGVAAADLYAALPRAQREHLAGLPAVVARLEQRAAAARAEVELVESLRSSSPDTMLATRQAAARAALAESVAALEGIRLDLLRLHADADSVAPLTTLMEAARLLGDDVGRMVEARRETEALLPRGPRGADRVPTPA